MREILFIDSVKSKFYYQTPYDPHMGLVEIYMGNMENYLLPHETVRKNK